MEDEKKRDLVDAEAMKRAAEETAAIRDGQTAAEILDHPLVREWLDGQRQGVVEQFRPPMSKEDNRLPLGADHTAYIALHAYIHALDDLEAFLNGKKLLASTILIKQQLRQESHPEPPADANAETP